MPRTIILATPPPIKKPKDFLGSDKEWQMLHSQQEPQMALPDPVQQTPLPELAPQKVEYPHGKKEKSRPAIKQPAPHPSAVHPLEDDMQETDDPSKIPEWLGSEDDWAFIGEQAPPSQNVLPIDSKDENDDLTPSGIGRGRPGSPIGFDDVIDEDDIKIKPEENKPVDPATLFDEVLPPDTPTEERNKKFNIREKIWYALNNHTLMTITYETLPDRMSRTFISTRQIEPDYVYWAGTNRHILVAWDHMKNDWRAFVVDRVKEAKLEGD